MISTLLRTAGGRHYRRDGPSGSSSPGSTEKEAEARHMVAVGSQRTHGPWEPPCLTLRSAHARSPRSPGVGILTVTLRGGCDCPFLQRKKLVQNQHKDTGSSQSLGPSWASGPPWTQTRPWRCKNGGAEPKIQPPSTCQRPGRGWPRTQTPPIRHFVDGPGLVGRR